MFNAKKLGQTRFAVLTVTAAIAMTVLIPAMGLGSDSKIDLEQELTKADRGKSGAGVECKGDLFEKANDQGQLKLLGSMSNRNFASTDIAECRFWVRAETARICQQFAPRKADHQILGFYSLRNINADGSGEVVTYYATAYNHKVNLKWVEDSKWEWSFWPQLNCKDHDVLRVYK